MTDNTEHTAGGYQISRRGVLLTATALGAASLIGTLGTPAQAAPKRGGTLRIGMAHGATSDSYDPATWDQAFVQVFAAARHCYLTEILPDGSLTGEVFESWDATPDAKTWIFKVRSGVTFHSGKTLTPDDVVASLNHHRGDDSKSAAKPIVEAITEMKVDGNAVVITLKDGNADFPFILSDYHLAVMPGKDGKIDPTSPDGCGGYIVEAFEPGVRAKLKRNPNYWKADRAHFDGIEILSILDSSARQNALVTGEVDVIDQVDLNTVRLLQRARNIKILATTGTQHYTFAMDTRAAPFNNNDVRLALKYAIDRQELVDKILSGFGSVGNDHPIGRSNPNFAEALEQRSYDPDKAKFHLKKAGLTELTVPLSAADAAFTGAVDAAVLYSEKAKAAGVNIEVVREPNDGYWSNVWMKKPWAAVYWGGRPTEDWMFTTAYASGVPWNDTFWENERFNTLLIEARSELDQVKRKDMYAEMQRIVRDEGGVVVPMFASYVMAHSDKVATPEKVAANWTMDGFRAVERWWFA